MSLWTGGFDSRSMCRFPTAKKICYNVLIWMPQRNLALEFRYSVPMHSRKTEYDIADHVNGSCRSVDSPGWLPPPGTSAASPASAMRKNMTSASRRRGRAQRWALLAALALCVGQAAADVHLHLDEHEAEGCTLCAISEPGHVLHVGQVDAQPSDWQLSNSLPTSSAALSRRPYEISRPRAPPVSVS